MVETSAVVKVGNTAWLRENATPPSFSKGRRHALKADDEIGRNSVTIGWHGDTSISFNCYLR